MNERAKDHPYARSSSDNLIHIKRLQQSDNLRERQPQTNKFTAKRNEFPKPPLLQTTLEGFLGTKVNAPTTSLANPLTTSEGGGDPPVVVYMEEDEEEEGEEVDYNTDDNYESDDRVNKKTNNVIITTQFDISNQSVGTLPAVEPDPSKN